MAVKALSTIPIGYRPGNKDNLRTYCAGNSGYYVQQTAQRITSSWNLTAGGSFSVHDGSGDGISLASSNFHGSDKNNAWIMHRLGKRSGRSSWFFGDYGSAKSTYFNGGGESAFLPHCVGVCFKVNTSVYLSGKSANGPSELRIMKAAGVYVSGESGSNNGRIYSYDYGTVASGSLGFDWYSIGKSTDHLCCYMANTTHHSTIHNKPLFLIGWLFDININHNGTGEQDPTGRLFQVRPICTFSGNGNQSKPDFILTYPYQSTSWSDYNPKAGTHMLKLNQS